MPNGNRTGPVGAGPMTGRGDGKCAGNSSAGWSVAGGQGMGRGKCCVERPHGYFRTHAQHAVSSADAMMLEGKIDSLHAQLASLEQQLAELGAKKED